MEEEFLSNESLLIGNILYSRDMAACDSKHVRPELFAGVYKRAYKEITAHRARYGEVPSIDAVLKKTGGTLKLPSKEESLQNSQAFLCDELYLQHQSNVFASALESAYEAVTADNGLPTNGISVMRKALQKIDLTYTATSTCMLAVDAHKRWLSYLRRETGEGALGILTGIDAIDFLTGGIQTTDLWTFLGYVNTGKSFLLGLLAVNMAMMGFRVLFLTKEMAPEQLMKRIDSIYNRMSFSDFNKGRLDEVARKRYKKFTESIEQSGHYIAIEQSTGGVSEWEGFITKHRPDIILADGPYLMTDDSEGDGNWEKINNVWIAMKNMAMNKRIPIVATMQLTEQKASLGNIAMAKYIAQSCDVMYGMEVDEDMKDKKILLMRSLKQREAENNSEFTMSWDFTRMDFTVLNTDKLPGYNEYLVSKASKPIMTKERFLELQAKGERIGLESVKLPRRKPPIRGKDLTVAVEGKRSMKPTLNRGDKAAEVKCSLKPPLKGAARETPERVRPKLVCNLGRRIE